MGLKPVTSPEVEAETIELTMDGETVQAKAGVSLYDVVASTGKIVPAMCYHYTFDPFGSCGMCLVMPRRQESAGSLLYGQSRRRDGDSDRW